MDTSEILSLSALIVAIVFGLPSFLELVLRKIKHWKLLSCKLNNWDINEQECLFYVTITNHSNHSVSFINTTINNKNVLVEVENSLKSTIGLNFAPHETKLLCFHLYEQLDDDPNKKYKLRIVHSDGTYRKNLDTFNKYVLNRHKELDL